ncbi:MAG: carboxypeptidase regulatory-like domain-containing protein [Phycisphaerae bacterium]|nr:carboxypeptidase regulatory-like domain-containing protein [Phycisphaerae bacterium]
MSHIRHVAVVLAAATMGFASAVRAEDAAPVEKPLNVFEGRVVDTSASPVAEAAVYVFHSKESRVFYYDPESVYVDGPPEKTWFLFPKRNGLRSFEGTTDKDGRFVAHGLKPGSYRVLAVHPQRGVAVSPALTQPNPGDAATITLGPPTCAKGQIKGLALAKQSEAILYGQLRQHWEYGASGDGPMGVLNTYCMIDVNTNGTFEVGPLPCGGRFELYVARYVTPRNFAADVVRKGIMLEAGKTTELVLDLTRGEKVVGQVIGPEGKPLDWVAVTLRPPEGMAEPPWVARGDLTDKDGRFALSGVPPGAYHLTAERWLPRTGPG